MNSIFTFAPSMQIPVADGVDLIIAKAERDSRGVLIASVECWNGTLIHSDRVRLGIAKDRRLFAKAVAAHFPNLQDEVERKLMEGEKGLADRIEQQTANQPAVALGPKDVADRYTAEDDGIYFQRPPTADGTPQAPIWICSRLDVAAFTRSERGDDWGRLLTFKDAEGRDHQWAMPMRMLAADGAEYRAELLNQGLRIAAGRQIAAHLAAFIQTRDPGQWARCVDRNGWHGLLFVLPDDVVGAQGDEVVVLQTGEAHARNYQQKGTLQDWREKVAAYCVGNSRLTFATSCGFAAPTLELLNAESGGFNLRGQSSNGKSTTLKVGCSVHSDTERLLTWRATANGLEGIAALHSDGLLCLDEIKMIDPREAGEVAYMLANGSGKQRATRYGAARGRQSWRLLFLSSGEISLADHMRAAGRRTYAGQDIRLADIPADTGVYGVFEHLHGHAGGAAFAEYLSQATREAHGTPIRAFLAALVGRREECVEKLTTWRDEFLNDYLPVAAGGQVDRVCRRFGLVAAAGMLATSLGITSWPEREAMGAAAACFEAWLNARGSTGPQEEQAALDQVRRFFELHAESRFTPWDALEARTINRAGFRRFDDGETEYFVFTEVFKTEICAGLAPTFVARILADRGWLKPGSDGKHTRMERLPGLDRARCCRITSKVLEG